MPFIKEIIAKKNIRILIWKIDETYTDLKALIQLTDDQERELERRKHISYKKQFLASRKLIKMAELNELNSFFYESLTFKKNVYFSISHTIHYAVVGIGFQRIGVDIEFYRPKVLNIKSKFINVKENYFMKSDNIKLITRLWTCKEAIFKCIYENKLSLKKNIVVEKFDIQSTFGQGEVYLNDKIIPINLHFSNFENHQLTLSYL
ncbi:4'-phosphopantetheinyl transferase superfamily protein [Bacteroidota bacterium]|nr:4'-phosphopantetheinyl transferase superfamily protein [Bacteroidota bacterium]